MTEHENQLAAALKEQLCHSFVVHPDGGTRWLIESPLLFDDGDCLPVVVRRTASDGWEITDDGMTVSHLYFDEFTFTEARMNRIRTIASINGAEMSPTHEISLGCDGVPTAYDIGDFLQLVSQIQGAALSGREDRDQNRYATTVRTTVAERLVMPDWEPNWSPPALRERLRGSYRADMRIGVTGRSDVVLFAASTSDRASVSALSVGHYRRAGVQCQPILAYHPVRVSGEAVYRFQDEVQDAGAAIAVDGGRTADLFRELVDRGVSVSSTA